MQPQDQGVTEVLANLSVGYIVVAALVLTLVRLVLAPSRAPAARSVAELVESLIIAGVLVFLIIRPFFLQAFYIPSESMEPTLLGHKAGDSPTGVTYKDEVHDHIFVNKLIYRLREPQRDEIIVFRAEKKADIAGGGLTENVLIKRLIGIPGDTIEVKNAKVYRNGQPLNEPVCDPSAGQAIPAGALHCIREAIQDPQPTSAQYAVEGPLKLGPGQLFVMGDNRNNSNDSRFWGTLPRNRVIGRAEFIFWPFSRVRFVR